MAGIEDLTNIMMAGGRGDVPPPGGMGGPPPGMGGPPPGGPPPGMGGPPPGGPPPGMGGPPPGGPPPGMGEMAAAGGSPMGEPPAEVEQDSAMLAEAVVERAQGDIGQAIAVLDTAKAMLVASVEQPPMDGMGGPPPGMGGPPMQAAYGRPLMRRGGGPLYRQGGGGMSESDILRQMVMDNLQRPSLPNSGAGQTGRAPSDRDRALQRLMKFRSS